KAAMSLSDQSVTSSAPRGFGRLPANRSTDPANSTPWSTQRLEFDMPGKPSCGNILGPAVRPPYNSPMPNPEQLPPEVMAAKFGIGRLDRHVFICLGPDCVDLTVGEQTWEYLKKRLKALN